MADTIHSRMPRYYCDYCDTYLTHDSPSVRKQHNAGYKHKANVRSYYQQFEAQQNQSLIDQKIKEHLGQSAYQVSTQSAYQISASYNALRPRLPVLPTPLMPMPGTAQFPMNSPLGPGVRPPIFPRPLPGYAPAPGMQPMMAPPGAAPMPGQFNSLPRPPTMSGPAAIPGTTMVPPIASGATSKVTPVNSQASSLPTTSGGFDSFNMSALSPEANHWYSEIGF